jgi:Ca2+-binding EF-hand superfamily protein
MDPTSVSIDENIDEFLSRERKKTLQQKFGINKEYIEKSDLEKLIQRMHLKIDTNDLNKIFNQLDVDGSGKVSVSTLVEHVLKKENEGRGLQDIFKKINDQLTTKSERIILKLKKLKEKAAFKNDAESLDDLDWYVI